MYKTLSKTDYIKKVNNDKDDLKKLYKDFLSKKKLSDILTMVCNAKSIHDNYSINNLLLSWSQFEYQKEQTKSSIDFVGILNSYLNWNKQGYNIIKGSKGLKVFVPIIKKEIDKDTKKEKDILSYFKIGSVFDITQTTAYNEYLKEQKEKDTKLYSNADIDFNQSLQFIKSNYSYDITIEESNNKCKGSYNPSNHNITLHQLTSHTLFHEFGHYLALQVLKLIPMETKDIKTKNNEYAKNEVLAEIASYILTMHFNNKAVYNFNYSQCWSSNITDEFTIEEFTKCFKAMKDCISKLSYKLDN